MTDVFDRLKTALQDRYTIEREIGAGGSFRFQAEIIAKRIAVAKR